MDLRTTQNVTRILVSPNDNAVLVTQESLRVLVSPTDNSIRASQLSLRILYDNEPLVVETISQTLVLTETYIKHAFFTRTISQLLTLTDSFNRSRANGYDDTITFTESFLVSYVTHINDVITFTQSFTGGAGTKLTLTAILALNDQFILTSGKIQKIEDYIPFIDVFNLSGSFFRIWRDDLVLQEGNVTTQLDTHFFTSPSLIVFKSTKDHNGIPITPNFITLCSLSHVIILPVPLFGDNQSSINEVLINNTVGGKKYSYVKTSKRKRLSYKFEFRYLKMIELNAFLDGNNLEWITLINWKSEVWSAKIINNPIVYEGISDDWYSVELNFEGYLTQIGNYLCLE